MEASPPGIVTTVRNGTVPDRYESVGTKKVTCDTKWDALRESSGRSLAHRAKGKGRQLRDRVTGRSVDKSVAGAVTEASWMTPAMYYETDQDS